MIRFLRLKTFYQGNIKSYPNYLFIIFITASCALISLTCNSIYAQTNAEFNLNVRHSVNNVSTFDRSKFMVIHSALYEVDWKDEKKKMKYLIDDLDVYFGRETGFLRLALERVKEDSTRPGFADTNHIKELGGRLKQKYAKLGDRHKYESKSEVVIAAQEHPFYPDGDTILQGGITVHQNKYSPLPISEKDLPKAGQWVFSTQDSADITFGKATGEFLGHYFKNSFGSGGTNGTPKPRYFEIMNEPVWPLVDYGDQTVDLVFKLHHSIAKEMRTHSPETQLGGFTTAFPDLDKNNFKQWEERWMRFIDEFHDELDFYSLHLYDFPGIDKGKKQFRKGGNMEATLDMISHYNYLVSGKVKPFLVSEYGSQLNDWYDLPWTPYRDWLCLNANSAMMIQFMERPNDILMAIPFAVVKGEWGKNAPNVPYYWRLMRYENEPDTLSGKYVWSEHIKFYELWSNVRGTRVDSKSTDHDVQVDAYVEANSAFLIINNLDFEPATIYLYPTGTNNNKLKSVNIKHLYLDDKIPVLSEKKYKAVPQTVEVGNQATMIVELTYKSDIEINESSAETKYYAESYFKPILSEKAKTFDIKNVKLGHFGEAILRLGIGRAHGLSLNPTVKINDKLLEIPADFRGDIQTDRPAFFGMLEIPVPYHFLEKDNNVSVKFPDEGGFISSIAMQVFEFSKELDRPSNVLANQVILSQNSMDVMKTKYSPITAKILPVNTANKKLSWSSTDTSIAIIDTLTGNIHGINVGKTAIKAKNQESSVYDSCIVTVTPQMPVAASGISVSHELIRLEAKKSTKISAEVFPTWADDKSVEWISKDTSIAKIDDQGNITGNNPGNTEIIVRTRDGGYEATSNIHVLPIPGVYFDDEEKYKTTIYKSGDSIAITCRYEAGYGYTVANTFGGIRYQVRHLKPDWFTVIQDFMVEDPSVIGTRSGTSTVKIPIPDAAPTKELKDGTFYFIYVRFQSSTGQNYDCGVFPLQIE